ncbi:MAG TPA: DUF3267 domain-containing protein [Clostridiales bacterium]|nr:DUF3267 domain-containing protein [Clostridiales bacterium]
MVFMGNKTDKPKKERKLTEAEIKRKANFEAKEAALLEKGYKRKDLTISIAKANFVGVLLTIPFIAAILAGYYLYNGHFGVLTLLKDDSPTYFIYLAVIFVSFIPLAVIHELIHGFVWSRGTENGLKDIQYGFIKEQLTPYCACLCPLSKKMYIIGSMMPMTILGILLGIVSIFTGQLLLLVISLLQVSGGAGDILITSMLLRYKTKGKDVVLLDHPTDCGLVAFEKV